MPTKPSEGDPPIRRDRPQSPDSPDSPVTRTATGAAKTRSPNVGPPQDPDAPPLDPDVNPDYEDDRP